MYEKVLLLFFVFLTALLTASAQNLIYIGANSEAEMQTSDSVAVKLLQDSGYVVTYVEDNTVESGYDYSGFDAAVFGESCSSSRVVAFGNTDNYPAPCVMLEPLALRSDKWGWISNDDYWQEDRDKLLGWDKLQILDETHFITNVFSKDQVITWSTADTTSWEFFAHGFNLAGYVPQAKALAINMSPGITYPCIFTLNAGTAVPGGVALPHRMVLIGTHAKGMAIDDDENAAYGTITITDDFMTITYRSLRWVLGANVGISDYEDQFSGVSVYPNPISGEAKLTFTLDSPGTVKVKVINLVGRTVQDQEKEFRVPGSNEIRISTGDLQEGIYLYILETGSESFTGKFQVVR